MTPCIATAFVLGDSSVSLAAPLLARCLGALAVSAGLTLVLGRLLIPWLRRREVLEQVQKTDSAVLAEQHRSKRGTPTMGGLLFLPSIVVATLLFADVIAAPIVAVALAVTVALAALGWRDDHIKLKSRRKHGLTKRGKFRVQLAISVTAALAVWAFARTGGPDAMILEIPFLGSTGINLGFAAGVPFILFGVLLLTASTNGVNLTDGLDGLAAGCVMLALIPFAVLGFIAGQADLSRAVAATFVPGAAEMAVFASATIGGCVGFLWFNCYPARIFMGDTGALALGGALGMTALAVRQELLLILVGGIFVIETLSVILQVFSFQVFGKRIFRIAPIHHHFQFGGCPEVLVTTRFWMVAAALAVFSLVTFPWQ